MFDWLELVKTAPDMTSPAARAQTARSTTTLAMIQGLMTSEAFAARSRNPPLS